jgi:hypothetical protein
VGCSPEEAFGLLRRESQNRNLKVQAVAADLVDRASVPAAGSVAAAAPDQLAHGATQAPFRRRGEAPARGR